MLHIQPVLSYIREQLMICTSSSSTPKILTVDASARQFASENFHNNPKHVGYKTKKNVLSPNPLLDALRRVVITLWLAWMFKAAHASTVTYQWSQFPLPLNLKVGVEQNIHIPGAINIRVGVPSSLADKLETEIIGNHLWIKATDYFPDTRLIVVAQPLGTMILQVRANEFAVPVGPIFIESKSKERPSSKTSEQYGFITLTRWVIQQLYAPERLLKDIAGVSRVEVNQSPVNIFRCGARVPTLCGGAVRATAIASWRSLNHYATAVQITNNLDVSIILDPRELVGRWRTAAFVHSRLGPSGHIDDSTVLVLISDQPYFTSIR